MDVFLVDRINGEKERKKLAKTVKLCYALGGLIALKIIFQLLLKML